MIKFTKRLGMSITAAWLSTAGAWAQHAGHPMPGPSSPQGSAATSEVASTCVQSSQQTLQLADQANARLEAARQTNNPTEMRAAIDDLQAALVAMRTPLAGCVSMASSAPGGPTAAAPGSAPHVHTSHGPPGTPMMPPGARTPAPGAPETPRPGATAPTPPAGTTDHSHRGHTMPAAPSERPTAAPSAVDPVCAMTVDPKTAPQATFQGQTYYFCSEADKEKFLKNPTSFVKKPSSR